MNKKLISIILAGLMVFSSVSVMARRTAPGTVYTKSYWPGEKEHVVDAEDCFATDNATKSSDGVQISPGGSATWGFFLPYASSAVKIVYTGNGDITVKTEHNTYNPVTLTGTGEDVIEFGKNLGYDQDPQWREWNQRNLTGYLQEYVEHRGEKEVTITASSDVKIKQLIFAKEMRMGPNKEVLPSISDYDMELTSTTLIHENANVIVVNGGRRYIDNNNTDARPIFINDSLYLPINTLAKALKYYVEDIPEKNYALLRSETHEVVMLNGQITVSEGTAKPVPAPGDVITYKDGQTYAAVRYFGELTGETVGYRDGLIAIDDKYTVAAIMTDESFYQTANNKFAAFVTERVKGNTYYVAQSEIASDSNDGSSMAPFKTLKKAGEVAQPGDTVIVREGVYREILKPQNSGTPEAPITFKAAEGNKVVISANEKLGKPYLYDEEKKEYIVGMPMDLGLGKNQIFINDEMLTEARYPDTPKHLNHSEISDAWGTRGDIYKQVGDSLTFYSDYLLEQDEDDYWKGGIYVGTFGMGYGILSGLIESSTRGSFKVSQEKKNQRWWWDNWVDAVNKGGGNTLNFGMIVGHKNAMNLPGEWVRDDKGRLHILLPEGADPETVQLEAKARQLVIDLTDKKFINIVGIDTIGGSVTMGKSDMCMLNNMYMKYITHYSLNTDARNGYIDIPFTNGKAGAPQRGEVGIYLGGTNDIIVNSHIDHSAGAAVYFTGTYSYIENNIMNDCGYMGSYTSGLHMDTIPWENVKTPRGGYAIYNNTVYNVAQSCLDFCRNEYQQQNHEEAPYLPSDISYNDFHDGCLINVDAGIVYCNGLNTSFDKKDTEVHHNYVYKTVDYRDGNPFDMGIYWDGGAHGFSTYNNMVFNTGSEGMDYMYQQEYNTFEAMTPMWNNQTLGKLTLDSSMPVADGLGAELFSENRPFFAGAHIERDREYLNNYTRFANGQYGVDYPARKAELSEGVTLNADNGYAKITKDGQSVTFKDVDFGDGMNRMIINYYCDSNWTFDELSVEIDGYDKTIAHTLPNQDTHYLNQTCTTTVEIGDIKGVHNVTITVDKFYSIQIGGISVYNAPKDLGLIGDEFSHYAYAANYTDYNKDNPKAPDDFMIQDSGLPTSGGVFGCRSTWTGYTLRYAKQEITEESTHFVMAAGSRDHYRGQLINIYLCEPTEEYVGPSGEPVAQFRTLNKHFYDQTPLAVPVLRDVKPGVYDIYVEYSDEEGLGKTSNISYFGFLKASADKTQYGPCSTITALKYDPDISKAAEGRPFALLSASRTASQAKKLVNVCPGATVGFKEVDAVRECNAAYISYMCAGEKQAGMPVTVRIENQEGKLVATGKAVTERCEIETYKILRAEFDKPLPEGIYTAYIDFGGKAGSGQSCQIEWFGVGD